MAEPTVPPPAVADRRRHDDRAAAAAVAILIVAVACLGAAIRFGVTFPIDRSLAGAIASWYPPLATSLFDTLGALPVFAGVMIVGAVACLLGRRPGLAAAFFLGVGGEIPSTIVKLIVDRPRPPAGIGIDAFVTTASYPSGHTVRAVLMAGLIVAAIAWRRRSDALRLIALGCGLAFAALVGLARIASGEHWPTDVLGGLLLGLAWLTICLIVTDRFEPRSAPSSPPADRPTG